MRYGLTCKKQKRRKEKAKISNLHLSLNNPCVCVYQGSVEPELCIKPNYKASHFFLQTLCHEGAQTTRLADKSFVKKNNLFDI